MRLKQRKSGLTLVEVIISLAILGIIAMAILQTFTFGFESIFSMGRKTKATQVAQEYMDLCYASTSFDTGSFNIIIATPPPVGYIIDATNSSATGPVSGLFTVKITVIYNQNRSVALTALVPANSP
jgi:prepilin-type N-terminal cleavage/methylation domain-containing protein